MTRGRCHGPRKMKGRTAKGGFDGTEGKAYPVSRFPASNPACHPELPSGKVGIDFYSQARKALAEHSPFDDAGDIQGTTVLTLPSGLAVLLSQNSENRKRQKKWHLGVEKKLSARPEPVHGRSVWTETEEYFKDLGVEDINSLHELTSFTPFVARKFFSIPLVGNPICDAPNKMNELGLDFNGGIAVADEVELGPSTEVDGVGADVLHHEEEKGSSLPRSYSGVEWLLGSRNKIYLTSERPSKKRKLMGVDAGLEKLFVASPVEQGSSSLCHYCSQGDLGNLLNQLIVCSSCGLAVHQRCYGVQDDGGGFWLCSWCRRKKDEGITSSGHCVLCPQKGGALKPVCNRGIGIDFGGSLEFAHLFCCQWMPEVYIDDTRTMEPIRNVDGIIEARRKLICYLCKVKCGACVRCSNGACRTAFHPMCAREASHRMEIWGKFGSDDVELRAFCSKHSEIQTSSLRQVGDPLAEVNSSSSIVKHQTISFTVNRPHNSVAANGDKIAGCPETTDLKLDKPAGGMSFEEGLSDKLDSKRLHEGGDAAVQKTADDFPLSEFSSFSLILKKLIDRGKVSVKDVALEIGVPPDLLGSALVVDRFDPGLQCKIIKWLKDHAHIGTFKRNMRVKFKSKTVPKVEEGSVADEVIGNGFLQIKEDVHDHSDKGSIEHLGDPDFLSSSTNRAVSTGGSDHCEVKEGVITEGNAMTNLKRGDYSCTVAMNRGHDSMVEVSGSFVHPLILKLSQLQNHTLSQTSNDEDAASNDRKGSQSEESSSPSICFDEESQSAISVEFIPKVNLQRLVNDRNMHILDLSPVDEVEGELIFYQHRLLHNSVARKQFCDDLIQKILKSLQAELDARRKRSWDAVLVNQYLFEIREAKKRGRKERRHKEAQAVLAAATAAAAASSRVSSFRKDAHDGSSRQENLLKASHLGGRSGLHSQQLPMAKLAMSQVLSETNFDSLLSSSDFSRDNPRTCEVCRRSETNINPVLVCLSCKVAVHLDCYRSVKCSPGLWYCEVCEDARSSRSVGSSVINRIVECGLCGGTGGAFRKSTDGQWIHSFCAEWAFESTFKRGQASPVAGMETVAKGMDLCLICRRKHGICVKCNYGHCQSTFHPSCARNAGFCMSMRASGGKLHHKAYCEKHSLVERAKAETHKYKVEEWNSLKKIRVELERLRLICERIVKREKLKRELVLCSHEILCCSNKEIPFLPARSCSSFSLPDISSESATTSLKGYTNEFNPGGEAILRPDDITVDSTIAGKSCRVLPVSMDNGQKTEDSSTSQVLMHKASGRASFSGKQIPYRPSVAASQATLNDGENRKKYRKHTETLEKELVMTSDQASMRNQRLPKGFVYVPIRCLSDEKGTTAEASPPREHLGSDG